MITLQTAKDEIAAGRPLEALKHIASLLFGNGTDARLYLLAFEALNLAMAQRDLLASWGTEEKNELYLKLLLQKKCPERPLIFHHGVASLITSQNRASAKAIITEVMGVVEELLRQGEPDKEIVLFLLVARTLLGVEPSQSDISAWHGKNFALFDDEDLKLPYSFVFNSREFGANRADLLKLYSNREDALDNSSNLSMAHLLLLEWLIPGDLFVEGDNSDLLEKISQRLTLRDASTFEKRAACSLIARHWRPGSKIDEQELERLGLPIALLRASQTLNHIQSVKLPKRFGARFLHNRPYQAARAALGLFGRLRPTTYSGSKTIRVAVCVSGQLRGFKAALKSWKKALLVNAEFDIYLHTWSDIGRAGAEPYRSTLPFVGEAFCAEWRRIGILEGYTVMKDRYPTLFATLRSGAACEPKALEHDYQLGGSKPIVVVEDADDPRFDSFTNQDKMHYKINAVHQLALESGKNYNIFLRLRPDISIKMMAFDWRDLAAACEANSVVYADHAFGVHYGQAVIGDQIAAGSSESMSIYSATWNTHGELTKLDLSGFPKHFTGHASLAQICWLNGIRVERIPLKLGGLLDPEKMSSDIIREAVSTDAMKRNDEVDQTLLKAISKDLGSRI